MTQQECIRPDGGPGTYLDLSINRDRLWPNHHHTSTDMAGEDARSHKLLSRYQLRKIVNTLSLLHISNRHHSNLITRLSQKLNGIGEVVLAL